jgi:hypothetical protein
VRSHGLNIARIRNRRSGVFPHCHGKGGLPLGTLMVAHGALIVGITQVHGGNTAARRATWESGGDISQYGRDPRRHLRRTTCTQLQRGVLAATPPVRVDGVRDSLGVCMHALYGPPIAT